MSSQYVWTAWNLTPDGWQRGETAENATDAARHRPDDALLVLVSMHHRHDQIAPSVISTLYRSPDGEAVNTAIRRHGGKPAD